ncbi:MAG: NifB/NifX family molybdenum-iron cluster-binding protein [Candidatus Odinarchaeota archaeon]
MKIAFPTFSPGGLDSTINPHFGKCDSVTLVTLDGNEIKEATVIRPQGEHSCGSLPVLFAQNGADACVVGGIGGRPFIFLQQYGIRTYTINQELIDKTVKEIVNYFLKGSLAELRSGTCQHHEN